MDLNLRRALILATNDSASDVLRDASGAEARAALDALALGEPDDANWELTWSERHSIHPLEDLFLDVTDFDSCRIRSLAGIEQFPGFPTVDLDHSSLDDLAPLRALQSLVALRIGVTPETDLSPLLDIGSLKRVAVAGVRTEAQTTVLRTLAERGVLLDDQAPDWDELSLPFEDRNLKLAVVNHLHESSLPESFPQFDEYALDKANLARVLSLPVTERDLQAIEALTWDEGGLSVHHLVYGQWDGEDSTFSIHTLAGIERLTNLRQLACYTRELPASELDALVARGITVFEAPFVPAKATTPHPYSAPLLWALQFSSLQPWDLPRNFWIWSPEKRRAHLAEIRLGHFLRQESGELLHTLRWQLEPCSGHWPVDRLPHLMCDSEKDLDDARIRDLKGVDVFKDAGALEIPHSEISDLSPIAPLRQLRRIVVTVTPDADLAVLRDLSRLTEVGIRGALTEQQNGVLLALERRGARRI